MTANVWHDTPPALAYAYELDAEIAAEDAARRNGVAPVRPLILPAAPVHLARQLADAQQAAWGALTAHGYASPQFAREALVARALGRLQARLARVRAKEAAEVGE